MKELFAVFVLIAQIILFGVGSIGGLSRDWEIMIPVWIACLILIPFQGKIMRWIVKTLEIEV